MVSRLVGKSVCACFSRACCDEKWPAAWRARAWEEDAAAAPAVYVSPAPPPFSFLGPLSRRKISCQARRKASRAAPRDSAATPGGRRDFAAPTARTPRSSCTNCPRPLPVAPMQGVGALYNGGGGGDSGSGGPGALCLLARSSTLYRGCSACCWLWRNPPGNCEGPRGRAPLVALGAPGYKAAPGAGPWPCRG